MLSVLYVLYALSYSSIVYELLERWREGEHDMANERKKAGIRHRCRKENDICTPGREKKRWRQSKKEIQQKAKGFRPFNNGSVI